MMGPAHSPNDLPFPFLKLSAELRSVIYSLVLGGGKAIHMNKLKDHNLGQSDSWFRSVCIAPAVRHEPFWKLTGTAHQQYDAAGDDGQTCDWGPVWEPCRGREIKCESWTVDRPPLELQLLLVCRQIHREAALLPFKENLFDAFGRMAPGWPCLTSAFSTLQCHALANLAVTCCVVNLRRLPDLFPGLKRLSCVVDSHGYCGCELDDIFSNAVERTELEMQENDKARWKAIRSQVEETCRVVRGIECLGVKVKLERCEWVQRFHTAKNVFSFSRQRWMIAKLENALVAKKSVGAVGSMSDEDGEATAYSLLVDKAKS